MNRSARASALPATYFARDGVGALVVRRPSWGQVSGKDSRFLRGDLRRFKERMLRAVELAVLQERKRCFTREKVGVVVGFDKDRA